MKVKLLVSRAGVRLSQNVGDVIEVSKAEGLRLIERGQAEPVDESPPPDPWAESDVETTTKPPPKKEKATKPRKRS